ncbi:hypothetical protein THOE12_70164 [Vibrio rotiferianus]|nr:hypothetical protein THOE12_70164 [Vibrio rotiferianus]
MLTVCSVEIGYNEFLRDCLWSQIGSQSWTRRQYDQIVSHCSIGGVSVCVISLSNQ